MPKIDTNVTGPPGRDLPLIGGTAHYGWVTRRGGTVRRPIGPYTPAVHALLEHLAAQGFTGAPRLLGTEGDTEILTYLEGEPAYRPGLPGFTPLPDWAQGDDVLVSVAELLARFHRAVESFDPTGLSWQRPVPAPWAGRHVTHNDPHPANLIFQDGLATGLIDFDLAGPGSVAFELAVAACFWVPIRDDLDIGDARSGRVGERLGLFLDGYRAGDALRLDVVRAFAPANAWIFDIIREGADQGHPAFRRMWRRRAMMAERSRCWIEGHQQQLLAAAR